MSFFYRQTGYSQWVCPSCNHFHTTLSKTQYKALYCYQCENTFYPGTVFYKAPRGPKPLPPRDTLMIGGGFPLKREVNRVYCENCSTEILSRVLDKMLHHDLTPIPKGIPISKPQSPTEIINIQDPDDLIG